MISFQKLLLTVLCLVLPFASDPVNARDTESPILVDSGDGLNGGGSQASLPVIPAPLLGRLPAVVAAAKSRNQIMSAELERTATDLQQLLGIGRTELLNFCQIIAVSGIEPWRMIETLAGITRQRGDLLARIRGLSDAFFTNQETRISLIRALEEGDLGRVDRLLSGVITSASTIPAAAPLIHELSGEIARSRLHYRQASDHFLEAASLLEADQPKRRLFNLDQAAFVLFRQSDDYNDGEALAQSVEIYRGLAAAHSRDKDPLEWGKAQHNLGTALTVQGLAERSIPLLEEATASFRSALLARTRTQAPPLWAASQQNLGLALAARGKISGDIASLKLATSAHRAALEERSREASPQAWAESKRSLALALFDLGLWERDPDLLSQAAESYSDALEEISRTRTPRAWALTKYNHGHALYSLGILAKDPQTVKHAAQSYREALGEQTRERDPAEWAATQISLGSALTALGTWETGTARLEEAIVAFRAALAVREPDRERMPIAWARTQASLGAALRRLGLKLGQAALLEEALDLTREAHARYMEAGMVHYEAYFTDRLVDWEGELAALDKQDAALTKH